MKIFSPLELIYKQVAVKSSCEQSTSKGRFADMEGCGKACEGTSEMFIYGTNLYGNNRCTIYGCRCYCALGKCKRKSHTGYDLYSYFKVAASYRMFVTLLYND